MRTASRPNSVVAVLRVLALPIEHYHDTTMQAPNTAHRPRTHLGTACLTVHDTWDFINIFDFTWLSGVCCPFRPGPYYEPLQYSREEKDIGHNYSI